MALLCVLLALQRVPALDVTARLDRTRVTAGDEVTLTVRARTRSADPVTFVLPALTGFTIVGSREVSDVTLEVLGGPVRSTTRELELRTERPGALVIGPVRVRYGGHEVATARLTVTVDSATPRLASALSPIARRLLDAARPPRDDDRVALTVILPGESILVGQQLDVIAAAWFPRELRTRLRRAPFLTLQTPEGVWSYPGAAPSTIAASRQVRGRWLDLFIAHEAVFPLTPGRIVIPPASVEYAVPTSFSFFSREDRYSLKSDRVPVTVLPLPGAHGNTADPQTVAESVAVDLRLDPPNGRVGEPIAVTATVSGVGNVALWPEPRIHWPPGVRAYVGEADTRVEPRGGRIAGTKTFHYLVVPDSAGAFELPPVRYPYYDLAARDAAVATVPSRPLAVAGAGEPRAARPLPPLERGGGPVWTNELAHELGLWGWLLVIVGPPLVAWLWWRRGAPESDLEFEPERAAARRPARVSRLGRLEYEFQELLTNYVPDDEARDGDGLGRALRAAGIESAVADHVGRVRDRLRAARYGPRAAGNAAELATELERLLRVLGADPARLGRRVLTLLAALSLGALGLPPRGAVAQAPSAEALYDAGALRLAADSFAARAAAAPRVPAHWYNLGAALYRAGADGKATAAWMIAARLAPRDPTLGRARELLAPPDAPSEPLLAVGLATSEEWALAAALGWIVLWGAIAARRRPTSVLTLALLTALPAGMAARETLRRSRPIAIVLNRATAVRVAPYGSASAAATVEAGAALGVARTLGPWLEVRRGDGVHGWVLATEVSRP
ncbi:MAG TPA: BatD family protein [Gemmatimonadales bacterium]|nr:BatD family protein [Gemmatimonadales bacterium]